jgi:RHS repeat-associated protein
MVTKGTQMIYQRNDNWLFPLLALIIALLILLPANALSAWNDVTASVSLSKTRPLYNYIEKVTYFDGSLTNTSGESFQAPIRLVIDSVTTPQVTVHNADGVTDDDKPYFDFSAHLGDGTLDSGETGSARQLDFYNPNRLRFNFTVKVFVEAHAPPPENHPPTAVPGGPYSGIAGQEIMFNGSESTDPDNDPLTFEWSFGDGATATGATPTHSYAVTGTYTVTLIVTDPEGANNTAQTQAAITDINHPPSLMPIAEQTVNEGQTLTFQVTGTDPDGDDLTYSANNLPEGSLFDPPTKTFSWTPTYDQAGSYSITFTVTDTGGLSGSIDVNITVRNVNRAPLLDPVSDRSIAETKPLTFRVTGSDPDGDDLAYSAINLPADAAFDAVSRTFSWTPASGFAGTYQAGFTVSDGFLTDSISVLIFVTHFDANNSPSLTPVTDQEINEGQTLTFHITGSDPNGDPLTFDVNGLPSNAAFESTADPNVFNFSWTPGYDQAGDYTANFTASDPGKLSDTINVDIVVHNVNRPPSLDPVSDRSIAETKPLSFQVTGSDPDGDELTFSVDHLPAGALFDPDAQDFSWTPTDEQAGEYDISFSVSDGDLTDSIVVHITVIDFNVNSSPSLTPVADQEINEGATLTFQVTASDPNDDSLTFNVNGLPPGAAFDATADPNTYSFSWTPDFYQAGDDTVNFTVSDPEGLSDTMDVNITVNNVNRPPSLDSVSGQNVDEGAELTFQLNGSDPDQDPLVYGATNLPEGATLVPETGAFSWIPTFDQSGSYQVTFSVSDGKLLAERQALIEVIDVNRAPSIVTATIPNGRVDQTYRAQVVAQDPDGDILDYSITDTTAPVTIDNTTGQLSWDKPSISDIGAYSLTVQVVDNRGGSDTRQYTLSVPDTIPPAIVLNAPKQGNPGETFSAEASASDNDAVVAVEVYGDRTDFSPPYQSTITQKKEITLPSELGTVAVHAFAWDPRGNKGEAIASIEVVATFDKTPPQVALNAPAQVAPGQVIRLTASVSDDVGVSTVTFSAEGTDIGTRTAQHPSIEYQIPAGALISSTIQFRATAVDFSGNSAFSEAASTVVGSGGEDTTPPDPELQKPETVTEDDPIPIAVATPNEDCLAQVDVYVNHTLAATYFAPDPGNFDVPMPDGVEGGMNVLVEVVVTDCSGNQTTTSDWIKIEEPGKGVVAGEVYNDRTGLPLADAEVTFVGEDGSTVSAITDTRGQYNFVAKAGTGRLAVTKDSFTQVERTGVVVPESGGLEAFDARLTPLGDASPTVPAALGAEITIPFSVITAGFVPALEGMSIDPSSIESTDVNLSIPAGALTQNQAFTLTQIGPQGLQDRLPGGWSPVGVLDISPHGIAFQTPASLAVSNPLGFDASAGIILAAWDETEHAWRVVSSADVSADGTISAQVPFAGQLAFILPDVSPQTPPVPVAGELLQGVSPLLIPEPVTTAIGPEPKIIFYRPGVHSDVGVSVSASSKQLSSGAPVLVNIAEEYNFYSDDKIVSAPCVQDIVLYSLNRPDLTAAFPVTPSYTFEPLTLNHGVINLDVLAPTDTERGIKVIAPEGGTVALSSGEAVILPEGAAYDIVPVDLEALTEDSLGIELPLELSFVGGVMVSFSGNEFDGAAGLSVPVPAGFDEASGQLLLVQLLEVQGATRMVLVGVGEVQGSNIVSLYTLNDNDIWFEGILSEGRYIFVQMHTGIGFATGTVFDTAGAPLDGAMVSADAMPVIAVSQNNGAYVQVVNTGAFSVMALDPDKMDSGTATGTITEDGEIARLDLYLVQAPPHVMSFFPADGQENVPLETAVKVTFSEPLNPETVIPENLTLTGPEGPVQGTLTLSSGNTQVAFRSTEGLKANTAYTFTASQGIQDLAGYALESAFVLRFTSLDTTPPPPPPAGNINATIPGDDGQTTITTTQGTAGVHDTVNIINKTRNTSTRVLVDADGSFSGKIEAGVLDEVVISIVDSAGNERVVPLGAFHNPDGSTVIGPEGGQLMADNGVILDIPAGAFPKGAVLRITGLTEEEIGVPMTPDFPFVAGFEIQSSAAPEIYLNASFPIASETDPSTTGIVAQVVDVYGTQRLAVVDTAKVIDGRLMTSSPPCHGIMSKFARYAGYLNEHQQMKLGAAILSMGALPMPKRLTYEIYWERIPDYWSFGHWGFGFSIPIIKSKGGESFWPAQEFISMIPTYGAANVLEEAELGYEYKLTSNCLPVPPSRKLKVVIRDADTGEVVQDIDTTSPEAGESLDLTSHFVNPDDIAPPEIIWTSWSSNGSNILEPGSLILLYFSEPVMLQGDQSVYLLETDSNQKVTGKVVLHMNSRIAEFIPKTPLPMGRAYTVVVEGITDFAGNPFEATADTPNSFSTFAPYVISVLDRQQASSDLHKDIQNFGLQDLGFKTQLFDESLDGKWHTSVFAWRQGDEIGDQLFVIDASNPVKPYVVSGHVTHRGYSPRRTFLLEDLHLIPRQSDVANPQFWRDRTLYYVEQDPSIRICGEPGSSEISTWQQKHCQDDHTCASQHGGCGDLLLTTAYSNKHSYLWAHDVTDRNDPIWISSRMLNDNSIRYGGLRHPEAPAGRGWAEGLWPVDGIDIIHQLNEFEMTSMDTLGVYVAVPRMGLELVDEGLNIPTINYIEREQGVLGTKIEQLESVALNAHLYFRDVNVIGSKVVTVVGDVSGFTGIQTLEVYNPDIWGDPIYKPLFLAGIPDRLVSVEGFSTYDGDGDGVPEEHDFAFVSGIRGGISIVDIPRGDAPPQYIAIIKTPEDTWTRDIAVDKESKIAYVSAGWPESGAMVSGILLVDVGLYSLTTPSPDSDQDGWDDRIVHKLKVTGTYEVPSGYVESLSLDNQRGLLYATVRSGDYITSDFGLIIAKICNCPDRTLIFEDDSGSIDLQFKSGSIDTGDGESEYRSQDGETSVVFITDDLEQGGQVFANFIAKVTSGLEVRYEIRETPFSNDPDDTILDLSGDQNQGVLNPYHAKIEMSIKPVDNLPAGSYVTIDFKDPQGVLFKSILLIIVPAQVSADDIKLSTYIDRVNGDICSDPEYLGFELSNDAKVTIKIDGSVIDQTIGDSSILMQDIVMRAGLHRALITGDMVENPGEHDFEITAKFKVEEQTIEATSNGKIIHDKIINEAFPVGHTMIKGVDIWDGHLTHSSQDINIPARRLPLEFSRSYSSAGHSSNGPLGAGWTHNFNIRLILNKCGNYVVIGGEGTGNTFGRPHKDLDRAPLYSSDDPDKVIFFSPQIGYHTTLVTDSNGDFDFFTKTHVRYHFEREPDFQEEVYLLQFIEEPNGNRITLDYLFEDDDPKTLDVVTDSSGRSLVFEYQTIAQEKRIIRIKGWNGNTGGNLLGLEMVYDYDEFGNLIRASRKSPDPQKDLNDERVEIYTYTDTELRDRHNLSSYTDPNGNTIQYVYHTSGDTIPGADAFGLSNSEIIKAVQEPENATTRFTYNFSSHRRSVSDPRSEDPQDPLPPPPTVYTLNDYGSTIRVDAPLGRTTVMEWCTDALHPSCPDINGNPGRDVLMVKKIDAEGQTHLYEYADGLGNLTKETVKFSTSKAPVTLKDGTTAVEEILTQYTYEPTFGKMTSKTDAEGNTTLYLVDAEYPEKPNFCPDPNADLSTGNLLGIMDAEGNITCYTYAAEASADFGAGDLVAVTDPRGYRTEYEAYDRYGNPVLMKVPEGNTATSIYDERSRLIETYDTFTHHTKFEYDGLDRTIKEEQLDDKGEGGSSQITTYRYFSNGEIETLTDGLGQIMRHVYDSLNRLTMKTEEKVIQADGSEVDLQTSYAYDRNGNVIRETDPRGVSLIHKYDELNRRKETMVSGPSTPDEVIFKATYDLMNNQLTETDLHGHTTQYVYDGLYRVVETLLPHKHNFNDVPSSGTARVRIAYDRSGHKVLETDANGQPMTFTYDGIYRLRVKTDADGNTIFYAYDRAGNKIREENQSSGLVTEWKNTDGSSGYDGLNRPQIMRQIVPLGGSGLTKAVYETFYDYEDSDNAIVVTNPRGFKTRIDHDGLDRVFQSTVDVEGLKLTTTHTYDGNGNLKTVKDPDGDDTDVTHDYDGLNRKIRSTYVSTPSDTGPVTEEFVYDGNNNLIRHQDKRGIVYTTTYDNLDRALAKKVEETITNGGIELTLTAYTYDDPNTTVTETDANGNVTVTQSDGLHRPTVIDDPDPDGLLVYEHDGVNKRVAIDKKGHRTEYDYDAINRLTDTREFDSAGALRTRLHVAYMDEDNQEQETDRRGIITTRQYDALQRLVQLRRSGLDMVDHYGANEVLLEIHEYDGNNDEIAFTDGSGNRTEYGYDGADRRVTMTEGVGSTVEATTTWSYDNVNNVLTVKDGRTHGGGFDWKYAYDARYRKLSATNGELETTTYAYDPNDNLTRMSEPEGSAFTTIYRYDELNTLLAVDETPRAAGNTAAGDTRFFYDGNRNKIAQQDANNNLVTYNYDVLNRLTDTFQHTIVGSLTDGTTRGSDPRGSQLQAGGNESTALHWQYDYDLNGNQNLTIDARGQRVETTYDYLDRQGTITYSNHAEPGLDFQMQSITYTYDGNSNVATINEVKRVGGVDVWEVTIQTYDPLDRLQTRIHSDYDDPVGKTIAYDYDIQGNRVAVVDPDLIKSTYTYDVRNRLKEVETEQRPIIAGQTVTYDTPGMKTGYTWWEDSLLKSVQYPNDTTHDRSHPGDYDAADRLLHLVNRPAGPNEPIFSEFTYTYNHNGNRLTQIETQQELPLGGPNVPETTTYTYDNLNRLLSVTYGNASNITYSYAPNGNRLTEQGTAPQSGQPVDQSYKYEELPGKVGATFNHVNTLTQVVDNLNPAQTVTYEYDRNLNQVAKEKGGVRTHFRFGIRDQILAADELTGAPIKFDYNHDRMRLKKISGGTGLQTRYLYDDRVVLVEYGGNDADLQTFHKYNYGNHLLSLVQIKGKDRESQFYLTDALRSTANLTDETGSLVNSYRYDAWGGIRDKAKSSYNPRQYIGHYRDEETGLHYFGARYYDSEQGRFLSQDPYLGDIITPPSLHRYLYAYSNPTVFIDLEGYFPIGIADELIMPGLELWSSAGQPLILGPGSGEVYVPQSTPLQDFIIENSDVQQPYSIVVGVFEDYFPLIPEAYQVVEEAWGKATSAAKQKAFNDIMQKRTEMIHAAASARRLDLQPHFGESFEDYEKRLAFSCYNLPGTKEMIDLDKSKKAASVLGEEIPWWDFLTLGLGQTLHDIEVAKIAWSKGEGIPKALKDKARIEHAKNIVEYGAGALLFGGVKPAGAKLKQASKRIATASSESGFGARIPYKDLNAQIRRIHGELPEAGSSHIFPKKSVSMRQLRTLTKHTHDEYMMFTKGNQRLVIRGKKGQIGVSPQMLDDIIAGKYGKWSGHTHPPGHSLKPGPGDQPFLRELKQKQSGIWGDDGENPFDRGFPWNIDD